MVENKFRPGCSCALFAFLFLAVIGCGGAGILGLFFLPLFVPTHPATYHVTGSRP